MTAYDVSSSAAARDVCRHLSTLLRCKDSPSVFPNPPSENLPALSASIKEHCAAARTTCQSFYCLPSKKTAYE